MHKGRKAEILVNALKEYFNNKYFQNEHFKSGRKPTTLARDEKKLKKIVKKHTFQSVRKNGKKWL